MEPQLIARISNTGSNPGRPVDTGPISGGKFRDALQLMAREPENPKGGHGVRESFLEPPSISAISGIKSSLSEAVGRYQEQKRVLGPMTGWEKYKDDQLLSNPGGDHYTPDGSSVSTDAAQTSVWGCIKKDVSDAFGNLKNFFENVGFGAKTRYRDGQDQIQESRKKGLAGTLVDFSKDLISALSFGAWRPDGEEAPEGLIDRVGFFLNKTKEAVLGDLIQGVPGAVLNMGEDLILAGWNLTEVVPDAALGHFETGRKLTTAIFDNGQVVIDYLTDIVPTGEAWLRVHASKLDDLGDVRVPIVYNLNMPEHYRGDARWRQVRNTPFRKTIETVGALLADATTLTLFGNAQVSSEGTREKG